jgi:hypothetical protein
VTELKSNETYTDIKLTFYNEKNPRISDGKFKMKLFQKHCLDAKLCFKLMRNIGLALKISGSWNIKFTVEEERSENSIKSYSFHTLLLL